VNTESIYFESFLSIKGTARVDGSPHLHVSMRDVEKLADLLVLLPPIVPLTSTIQGGLACSAVLELEMQTMQHLSMIVAGFEGGGGVVVQGNVMDWAQIDPVDKRIECCIVPYRIVSYRIVSFFVL
jgi:hypothetical protein